MALQIAAYTLILVLLVVLDLRGKADLTHPAGILVTAAVFLVSFNWALFMGVSRWVAAAVLLLLGAAFGLYVLVKANLRPRGTAPADRARRLLADGIVLGIPLQALLTVCIVGYVSLAVQLKGSMPEGVPALAAPLFVLLGMHVWVHTWLLAWILDAILIWFGVLFGALWSVQAIFLVHGTVRGLILRHKVAGSVVSHALLALVPIVSLILAVRLRAQLKRDAQGSEPEEAAVL